MGGRSSLVIHPGALGDVLQAVPALRAIGRDGPLAFVGQPRLGRLLRGMGLVEPAFSFDGFGLEALFTREPAPSALVVRLARFDRVISWFGARDAVYVEQLGQLASGAVIAPPAPEEETPVWRHLLATTGESARPDLSPIDVPPPWRDEAGRMLAGLGVEPARPVLVVHPGAGGAWKRWPADDLARVVQQVVRQTGGQAVIHQGPADRDAAGELSRALDERGLRLVEPDLAVLAALLGQAAAYLGGDSGVSHLAAAVGVPAVIRFPAATRERWAPWSPTAAAIVAGAPAAQMDREVATLIERMGQSGRGTV